VLRLVPELPTLPPLAELIACPTCHAKVTETCRTKSGHTTTPHHSRLAPRLCPCGELPISNGAYCRPCGFESIRVSKREHLRRLRAARKEVA